MGILGRATRAGAVWIGVKMFKEKPGMRGEGGNELLQVAKEA